MRHAGFAVFLLPAIAWAAQPPDESKLALARLAETAAQLASISAPADRDALEADTLEIPPAAAELHRRFKSRFGELLEAWPHAPSHEAWEGLSASLRQAGVEVRIRRHDAASLGAEESDARQWFGRVYGVQVTRPPGHPHLLAVTLELSLGVGTDTTLYLIETRGDRVRHLLEWSAEQALALNDSTRGETTLPGAQHGLDHFEYRLSPADQDGRFFVVVGWVAPRYVSNWGWVQWAILRPGQDAESPAVLTHGSDSAYDCFDECFSLSVDGSLVTIEYTGAQELDAGLLTRSLRHRIRVTGDQAEQSAPPAVEPQGFVADWARSDWERAQEWSNPANTALADWHAQVLREGSYTEFNRRWVDACPPATKAHVVELLVTPDEGVERFLFFRVAEAGESFRLEEVTEQAPVGEGWIKIDACPDGP